MLPTFELMPPRELGIDEISAHSPEVCWATWCLVMTAKLNDHWHALTRHDSA
jgi:hypothetical protein